MTTPLYSCPNEHHSRSFHHINYCHLTAADQTYLPPPDYPLQRLTLRHSRPCECKHSSSHNAEVAYWTGDRQAYAVTGRQSQAYYPLPSTGLTTRRGTWRKRRKKEKKKRKSIAIRKGKFRRGKGRRVKGRRVGAGRQKTDWSDEIREEFRNLKQPDLAPPPPPPFPQVEKHGPRPPSARLPRGPHFSSQAAPASARATVRSVTRLPTPSAAARRPSWSPPLLRQSPSRYPVT